MEGLKVLQGGSISESRQEVELSRKGETGFVSPAADHLQKPLDLEELIVHRPAATFYVRADGNAMKASGIHDGDLLVVDRSVHPADGAIVIAAVEEEPVVRRLVKRESSLYLISDDTRLEPVRIHHDIHCLVWGVITHVIHKYSS